MEAERALSLRPETLFFLDGIGFLMTLMGGWERGSTLIRKVMQLNPFYGKYAHFSLWVNCIRQKDYADAYQKILKTAARQPPNCSNSNPILPNADGY